MTAPDTADRADADRDAFKKWHETPDGAWSSIFEIWRAGAEYARVETERDLVAQIQHTGQLEARLQRDLATARADLARVTAERDASFGHLSARYDELKSTRAELEAAMRLGVFSDEDRARAIESEVAKRTQAYKEQAEEALMASRRQRNLRAQKEKARRDFESKAAKAESALAALRRDVQAARAVLICHPAPQSDEGCGCQCASLQELAEAANGRIHALESASLAPRPDEAEALRERVVEAAMDCVGRGKNKDVDWQDAQAELNRACAALDAATPKPAQVYPDLPESAFLATGAERDVLTERAKQRTKWGDAHDDGHGDGQMLRESMDLLESVQSIDPRDVNDDWGLVRKHPSERDRLVIAAALIVADIERRDRASSPAPSPVEAAAEWLREFAGDCTAPLMTNIRAVLDALGASKGAK